MIEPAWYHRHGKKMRLGLHDTKIGTIYMESFGGVARLEIRSVRFRPLWEITWRVFHSHEELADSGTRYFTDSLLQAAFDLSGHRIAEDDPIRANWFVQRHHATTGMQGKFIRRGPYLNIPCVGTSQDCEPNLSILVTSDMESVVMEMLRNFTRQIPAT